MVFNALAQVAGTDPAPATGGHRGDLTAVASTMAGLFNTALARSVVPGLLGDLRNQLEQAAHRGQRRHCKRPPLDHLDQRAARLRRRSDVPGQTDRPAPPTRLLDLPLTAGPGAGAGPGRLTLAGERVPGSELTGHARTSSERRNDYRPRRQR